MKSKQSGEPNDISRTGSRAERGSARMRRMKTDPWRANSGRLCCAYPRLRASVPFELSPRDRKKLRAPLRLRVFVSLSRHERLYAHGLATAPHAFRRNNSRCSRIVCRMRNMDSASIGEPAPPVRRATPRPPPLPPGSSRCPRVCLPRPSASRAPPACCGRSR